MRDFAQDIARTTFPYVGTAPLDAYYRQAAESAISAAAAAAAQAAQIETERLAAVALKEAKMAEAAAAAALLEAGTPCFPKLENTFCMHLRECSTLKG